MQLARLNEATSVAADELTRPLPRKERVSDMSVAIRNGFPIRRCSWSHEPIVSAALTRRMIRWLDSVCARRVAFKGESGDERTGTEVEGAVDGTGDQNQERLDES